MLGIHVAKDSKIKNAKSKTMLDAIKRDTQLLNLNAVQIFTSGPRSYNRNKMDYGAIKAHCRENNISISTHGTYLSVGVWKITRKNINSFVSKKVVNHIVDMLQSAKSLDATGVVIHLPNKCPDVIVETLAILSETKEIEAAQHNGPYIILEMPASRPDARTYETAEKLNNLCNMIRQHKGITLKWCLCIDTSHQYSCGVNFGELHEWHSWISALTDYTICKIKIFHLNGNNAKNFGRGKDVHEIIMSPEDGVWRHLMSEEMLDFIERDGQEIIDENNNFYEHLSKGELKKIKESSLNAIVKFAKNNGIVLILEINAGNFIYTKFAIEILHGLLQN